MEKLIRFINEYGHTSACWPFETYRIEPAIEWYSSYLVLSRDDNWEWDWKDWHLPIPRLISKEYGFIWWLVDNDKIDFSRDWKYCEKSIEEFDWLFRTDEDSLIMVLAIQDEPIDFLLSILK